MRYWSLVFNDTQKNVKNQQNHPIGYRAFGDSS